MTHENEYFDNMVTMLELIWGEGYMAPGGPGNVAKLLRNTQPAGKRILDIGCGIGGPAMEMASTHGAIVTGIDLESPLVDRANAAAKARGLDDRCTFQTVSLGPLPFPDGSFDIVISSGAITQSSDKGVMFKDIHRLLSAGGIFSCYEWMRTDQEYSAAMYEWFRLEGLTYDLRTLPGYVSRFEEAGFTAVESEDASLWYRKEARREYNLIKGDLYPRMLELLGKEDADHFVQNWEALAAVCDTGELVQGYCRGTKS